MERNQKLMAEIESHKNIEEANSKMLTSLVIQRDHFLRKLSEIKQRRKESEETLVLKEKDVDDLRNLFKDKEKRRMDFQDLYDLVKGERNRIVHHIQVKETNDFEKSGYLDGPTSN